MSTICFTGHRSFSIEDPASLEAFRSKLIALLNEYIENHGVDKFYAGGASGFDNFAASCVLEVKKQHPKIKLIVVLPCDRNNFSAKWSKENKELLFNICENADIVNEKVGSTITKDCYKIRNRCLVDHADYCIAYYDEKDIRSGTGQTVRMARDKVIPVINLFE